MSGQQTISALSRRYCLLPLLATSAIYPDVHALSLFHDAPSLPGTSDAAARPGHLSINLGSSSMAATGLADDSMRI